jgi:hypothetical protein
MKQKIRDPDLFPVSHQNFQILFFPHRAGLGLHSRFMEHETVFRHVEGIDNMGIIRMHKGAAKHSCYNA